MTGRDRIAAGDWRANNPRFAEENLARNLALLRPLEEIAQVHGAKPAQVALAWVLSRGEHVIPIPGMKRRTHLEENVAAVEIVLDARGTGPAGRRLPARCGGRRAVHTGDRPLGGPLGSSQTSPYPLTRSLLKCKLMA